MRWTDIWISLLGTTSFWGIDMGFWAGMATVFLIVVLMNAVFWSMKPQNPDASNSPAPPCTGAHRQDCAHR